MAESDGKKLETQLKKVTLASACTLTGPTGYQTKEPNGSFDETCCFCGYLTRHAVLTLLLCFTDGNFESLEDKVRRVRQEGSVYRWEEKEEGDETG